MYKALILFFIILFLNTSLFAEEKKDENSKKPKVKTGVELKKGNNAPGWDKKIIKKKKTKEEVKKENKKEEKKEDKKKDKKEVKKEMKKLKKENKIEKKKQRIHNHNGKKH